MNSHPKGWLRHYIEFRTRKPFPTRLPTSGVPMVEGTGVHHELEEAIYYFLQPTGLLYGFPLQSPFSEETYQGLDLGKGANPAFLIFLDALFACLVTDRHYLLENLAEEGDHFPFALKTAEIFFTMKTNAKRSSPLSVMGRFRLGGGGNGGLSDFENELTLRLENRHDHFQRQNAYYNSFLFFDLYDCLTWQREMLVNPDAAETSLEKLATRQVVHRHLLIRLMIAASNAGGGVTGKSERRLIEWFLKSSNLGRNWQYDLRKDMNRGLTLGEIDIPELPWLVRRFMLEAIMMTVLIDRDITEAENTFLNQVVQRLELWEGELNQSMMALEVFLLNQEDHLTILQHRNFMINVGENLRNQATAVLRKNLDRIVTEIKETQELYTLLLKSTHASLSPEEKGKVRAQLLDIMKTIPALAIFALPGGAIILPILIKLLPFNLLPSSFED